MGEAVESLNHNKLHTQLTICINHGSDQEYEEAFSQSGKHMIRANENPIGWVERTLTALRELPIWLFGGVAAASWALLFLPGFAGVDPTKFRDDFGAWLWASAITFSILAFARTTDASVLTAQKHKTEKNKHRILRLVPHDRQRWWNLAKQQDDSVISTLRMQFEVTNLGDQPVRFVNCRLIKPRNKDHINANVVMPGTKENPFHSEKHAAPAHSVLTAILHIMTPGALGRQGHPIRVTIGVIDQFGEEYTFKNIVFHSNDQRLASPTLQSIFHTWRHSIKEHIKSSANEGSITAINDEWKHNGRFEKIDLILKEEQRHYAANGRTHGGLGSLNVKLQNEPNNGFTKIGEVPSLLWDKNNAVIINSTNLERLMALYNSMQEIEKDDAAKYLRSHLNRTSPFVNVGYFIFLALHRIGQTIDALKTARQELSGDKFLGYSNLLGTLSAIISHEHFNTEPNLCAQIENILAGETEHDFKLQEKINLARLLHIDKEYQTNSSSSAI
jgi:hypothetical protein